MTDVTSKPYKLGIALSGGGAKGFAHVGALRAFEELGIKPDCIAGVSAGSVVAVMYAAGVPCHEMMKLFSRVKFRDLCQFSIRGGGFFKIERFKKHIKKVMPKVNTFEDLNIPTFIGATDLDHGTAKVFDSGPLYERMAASCSVPIVFHPVVIDGVRYVDGGVMHNVPSWILRDKCEQLIGINCSPLPSASSRSKKNSILEVGLRTYDLMLKGNVKDDMDLCDYQIELPEMSSYKTFDLKEINNVYLRGYTATRRFLQELMERNPEVFAANRPKDLPHFPTPYPIEDIQ
ncbi:MAG: patatin-like phospholipase family protein [Muribaculaceae bacterium]|nr:patatin-like phospholipase family protein [Muribaculaceae bacterium]